MEDSMPEYQQWSNVLAAAMGAPLATPVQSPLGLGPNLIKWLKLPKGQTRVWVLDSFWEATAMLQYLPLFTRCKLGSKQKSTFRPIG